MAEVKDSWSVTARKGVRPSYVDAARAVARMVTTANDPPGSRPRDITWLEGNRFSVEGLGICLAEETIDALGMPIWKITLETPVVTVARPEDRVPAFPAPDDDTMPERRGLAEKMLLVRRLIDELWEQIDPDVIGPEAYLRLETSGKLEAFHRRSGTVSTALGDMAAILSESPEATGVDRRGG
jgi:hypothetical protein